MFDGLWDHSFDRVYHYVIPKKNQVVNVHKHGHDLQNAPPSIVGSREASRQRRSGQRGRQLSSATNRSYHDIDDLPPEQRPPPGAQGIYEDEEEDDFITPDGRADYRQHDSQRPGETRLHRDWGPTPINEQGQPAQSSQPPSRAQSVAGDRRGSQAQGQGSDSGRRSRSQSQQSRYVPPEYQYNSQQPPADQQQRIANQPYGDTAAGAAAGAASGATAYKMDNYLPYSSQNSRDAYGRSASAGRVDRYRPQSYGGSYNDNDGYYDDEYDERRNSRRDRQSSKSKSRRSTSRGGLKGKLDKNFDYRSEKGLTAGALGALAGGLVGHEVGKGPMATVAGVVLGGLGANAFEARNENKDRQRDEQAWGSKRSKSTDGHDRYRRGGGGGRDDRRDDRRRDYDDYDSYDEDADQSPRRRGGGQKSDRRRDRSSNNRDGNDDGAWNWNNILKS
ncbi:MAG: hypothetical protein Q9159_002401 [Coniocarpon cinnabarinum]